MTLLITLAIIYLIFIAALLLAHLAIGTFAYFLGLEKSWTTAIKKAFKNW